jgi:hypothetical protein
MNLVILYEKNTNALFFLYGGGRKEYGPGQKFTKLLKSNLQDFRNFQMHL